MLTGDNEPPEETQSTTVETTKEEKEIKEEIEDNEKAISYNEAINK